MNILHISNITNNKSSGMSVVVPKHTEAQNHFANVAIINCNEKRVLLSNTEIKNFKFKGKVTNGDLSALPLPFNKPDLVVFHGIYFPIYLKFKRYLSLNNIPYIIIPHGSLSIDAQNIKKYKKKVANFLFFNKMITNSLGIQYLSEGENEKSIFQDVNSFISCNGISITDYKKSFNSNANFKMIYIGRIDIYTKGLDLLIEACKLIKREMEEFKITLDIFGPENNESNNLRKNIVENGMKDIVKVHGPIYDEQKIKKLLESDVFIQTSRFEGQPMGVVEALSFGLPTILTNGTNLNREVVLSECGWDAGSNEYEIGEAIIQAYLDKEKLEVLSSNAYKLVKEKYNWKTVASDAIRKYKTLLCLKE